MSCDGSGHLSPVNDPGKCVEARKEAPDPCPASSPTPSFSDLTCEGDCTDMVMSRIIMPDAATATQYGWDFNGDGTPDNALGSVFGALFGMCGHGGDLADFPVTSGRLLHLLRLKVAPDDLASTGPVQAQVWIAESRDCCPQTPPESCGSVADKLCFSGSSPHSIDPTVPGSPPMGGTVDQGKLVLGPGQMRLRVPVPGGTTHHVDLSLQHARIRAQWADGTITRGLIAGTISSVDFECTVLPALADAFTAISRSSASSQNLCMLYDANKDDVIDADELACSSIIQTFLAGDVDVDHDGEYELSFGLGFEAVGAVIVPPGATDMGAELAQDAGVDAAAADHGE